MLPTDAWDLIARHLGNRCWAENSHLPVAPTISVTAFDAPRKIASLLMKLHEMEIVFLQPQQIVPRLNPLEKFLSLFL